MALQDDDYLVPEEDSQEPDDYEERQRMRGTRDEREEERPEKEPSQAEKLDDLKKRTEKINERFKNAQKNVTKANKQVDRELGQIKKATARSKKATRRAARNAARQAGREAAQQTAKQGFRASMRAGMMAARATYLAGAGESMGATLAIGLAFEIGVFAITHPIKTLKIILIIALALFAIMALIAVMLQEIITDKYGPEFVDTTSLLSLRKEGPETAKRLERFTYTISVSYPNPFTEITITDRIPDGLIFDGSNQNVTYDPPSNTVVWKSSENNLTTAPLNTTIAITVFVANDNFYAINWTEGAVIVPESGGTPVEGYVAPADASSCGGKYAKYISRNYLLTKNYGDPACTYVKEAQYQLLQKLDPQFADLWFLTITPGESGYNPNAWASPNAPGQGALDKCGAWGLYQMGSSGEKIRGGFLCTPGLAPPSPGKNGIYDRGDVNWEVQTTNAINYNRNVIHCNFRYWATARSVWGKYSC